MECPRCGGEVATYTLSGDDAEICESCGFVGVSVEHEREQMEFESWNDAFERFYEQQQQS